VDFSKEYAKKRFFWGIKPNKSVVFVAGLLSRGKALDIGMGEGKNAVFLAKKGFNVKGVDVSSEAIKKSAILAKRKNVKILPECADIKNFNFKCKYDLIISTFTLHFLPKKKSLEVLKKIKAFTKPGGFNLVALFIRENSKCSEAMEKRFGLYLYEVGELKRLYSGWKIVKYAEKKELDNSHGKAHYHNVAIIIAQKVK
jgi:2-polyprenyl-3-methyl-5-hydroxy-6-metoxy-1,4-benzoquinol methylase